MLELVLVLRKVLMGTTTITAVLVLGVAVLRTVINREYLQSCSHRPKDGWRPLEEQFDLCSAGCCTVVPLRHAEDTVLYLQVGLSEGEHQTFSYFIMKPRLTCVSTLSLLLTREYLLDHGSCSLNDILTV